MSVLGAAEMTLPRAGDRFSPRPHEERVARGMRCRGGTSNVLGFGKLAFVLSRSTTLGVSGTVD